VAKRLARFAETRQEAFSRTMEQINEVASSAGLVEYRTYSRIWEYPWLWLQLSPLEARGARILDIGSETSPFPWFLGKRGLEVIVSDVTANYWRAWRRAEKRLGVSVDKRILDAQDLDLPTAGLDVYLSVSVMEHVPDKAEAIAEAARVLRPGGLLVMTFDICEPGMGMTFPEWNGRALTMREFDDLFRDNPWFEPGLADLRWNTEDIPEYLAWHRTTAPHHNYVTGGAAIRRNGREWEDSGRKDRYGVLKGKWRTARHVAFWYLRRSLPVAKRVAARYVAAPAVAVDSLATSVPTSVLLGEPLFQFLGMRHERRPIDLSEVRRVLVVRLDEVGDLIMTTPFLRELRRNIPRAWITLVVQPHTYNLVERCPYVNEVVTYDKGPDVSGWRSRRHWRALVLAWKHLWHRRFNLAIVPRWDADRFHASVLAYFSGAPWRLGYSEKLTYQKRQGTRGYDRLFTHVMHGNGPKHEVERNLHVIRRMGWRVHQKHLEIWLGPEDERFAEAVLARNDVRPEDPLVAFGPGAGIPGRMWPVQNFAELGSWLRDEFDVRILIVGGEGEEPLGRELERRLGDTVIDVVGQTTLRQAAALLKRCHLYCGNDSGPMHLAAAAGLAVVELSRHPKCGAPSHENSPTRFGPWNVRSTVIQPERPTFPCTDHCGVNRRAHCILNIAVDRVKQSCSVLLSEAGIRRSTMTGGNR